MKTTFSVAVMVMLIGCEDRAKPYLDHCKFYEAKGELEEAISRCQIAASTNPESKAGKEAWSKVIQLSEELEKRKKAKAAEEAKAASAVPPTPPPPAAPNIQCKRTPGIDDICESSSKVGFNCWGGTSGDVERAHPGCEYIADSQFCCFAQK